MTHLCVPIFVTELAKSRRDIAAAAAAGADLVELRIDKLRDLNALTLLLEDRILPAIVTCRSESEGGFSQLDDAERADRLKSAVEAGAQSVDLELQAAQGMPQFSADIQSRLILSCARFLGQAGRSRPDHQGNERVARPGEQNRLASEIHSGQP